jgi:hypothetical protein
MSYRLRIIVAIIAAILIAGAASAQQAAPRQNGEKTDSTLVKAAPSNVPAIAIQHMRPQDKRGLHIFEAPKNDGIPYNGFRLDFGAAFTQQFQSLDHETGAAPRVVNNVDQNALIDIGPGFNNAVANLYLNAQLAPGIRVALTTYLSSRHHQETWVKDGYLLVDELPLDVPVLNNLMKYVTVKAGHFEINYGDAHFRRSDNGNALYNPFVGNLILEAFTTEIGSEVYFRTGPFLAMGAFTGGEIKGNITQPDDRGLAYIGKLGFDKQFNPDLRVRLTGSAYHTGKSAANTLYAGDRAGSRYYMVLENTAATTTAQASSGQINPGFRNEVTAFMVNPFVKFSGLELFGVIEQAEGRAKAETKERKWEQYSAEAIYRFLGDEQLYVGARYNQAKGELLNITNEVSLKRTQIGAGWFVMPTVLLKGEFVTQKYFDFPTTDIRRNGKFNGFVVEGVVSF